nr:uncharacterized protein LOC107448526 [Parasteatoda tepidariorum]XP_042904781.1 uncharacterized protein LOC107448526 [Parasteatoda tepidariorum]
MQEAHDDDVSAETGTCLNEEIKKEGQRVIDVIGGHGPWQLRHWTIFFLASFCTSLHLFSTLPLISHSVCSCSKINEENNVSTSSIGCNILTRCDNRTNAAFDELSNPCFSPLPTSALEIADEENLHCTNVATVFYAKCLFVIGALIATVATYPLLNRYGRRSVSLTSCFLLCACSLAGIWAFAVGPYLILKFVISIGVINVYLTAAFTCTYIFHALMHYYFFNFCSKVRHQTLFRSTVNHKLFHSLVNQASNINPFYNQTLNIILFYSQTSYISFLIRH